MVPAQALYFAPRHDLYERAHEAEALQWFRMHIREASKYEQHSLMTA